MPWTGIAKVPFLEPIRAAFTAKGRFFYQVYFQDEGVAEAEYVAVRTARDATLAMPTLLLPAVQVNIRAGALPPPEGNGVRYLKIPLDAL